MERELNNIFYSRSCDHADLNEKRKNIRNEVNNNSTPYVVTLYDSRLLQLFHLMDQNISAGISRFMNGSLARYRHTSA